jgi:hypothetical protein
MYTWKCHNKTTWIPILNNKKCPLSKTDQESKTDCRLIDTSVGRENIKKSHWMVNIVDILCTHVWKWKMRLFETIPGMGERL